MKPEDIKRILAMHLRGRAIPWRCRRCGRAFPCPSRRAALDAYWQLPDSERDRWWP